MGKNSAPICTHKLINQDLCGNPIFTKNGNSKVHLITTPEMAADESGLIHGGFVFGLADYAAMIAINHPNVVLGSSDVKFLKPVCINDSLTAEARVESVNGKKHIVSVCVFRKGEEVFTGTFTCFVLDKNVLE